MRRLFRVVSKEKSTCGGKGVNVQAVQAGCRWLERVGWCGVEDGGWKLECAHSSDLRRQPRIDRGRERGGGETKTGA